MVIVLTSSIRIIKIVLTKPLNLSRYLNQRIDEEIPESSFNNCSIGDKYQRVAITKVVEIAYLPNLSEML